MTAWDEKEHPRGPNGKFAETPGQSGSISSLSGLLSSIESGIDEGKTRKLTGGNSSELVERVRFNDGTEGVRKKAPDQDELAAEILSAKVGDAVGAPVPAVTKQGNDTLVMRFAPGTPAVDTYGQLDPDSDENDIMPFETTPAGKRIGLLDVLVGNQDRHNGNIILDSDGNPQGIDHGRSLMPPNDYGDDENGAPVPDPQFAENTFTWQFCDLETGGWTNGGLSKADYDEIRPKLEGLRSEFKRTKPNFDFGRMMKTFEAIASAPDLVLYEDDEEDRSGGSRIGIRAKTGKGVAGDPTGDNLHDYWTQDPEGLAKWASHEHPWTELYHHLLKHMNGNEVLAKATASKWYHDVFGHWPGPAKGADKQKKEGLIAKTLQKLGVGGRSVGVDWLALAQWRASFETPATRLDSSGVPAEVLHAGGESREVSEKPWSGFTAADYTPEQWKRACLIDTEQGDEISKGRYKLPVREPSGALNRNGAHAAASVLAGGRGGVQATPEQKRSAARKLAAIYRNDLDEEPPDSLLSLAGEAKSGA